MGGKKKKGGKGGGKAGADGEGPAVIFTPPTHPIFHAPQLQKHISAQTSMDDKELIKLWEHQCISMQMQLAERTDDVSRAAASKRLAERKAEQMAEDLDTQKKDLYEITRDMTRQYKGDTVAGKAQRSAPSLTSQSSPRIG